MARARSCTQMLGRDQQDLSVFGPLPGNMMGPLTHFYLELRQSRPRVGDQLDNKNPGSRVADPTVAGLVESDLNNSNAVGLFLHDPLCTDHVRVQYANATIQKHARGIVQSSPRKIFSAEVGRKDLPKPSPGGQ